MSTTIKQVEVDTEALVYTFGNTTQVIALSIGSPLSIETMSKAIESLHIKCIDYNRGEVIVEPSLSSLVDFSYSILMSDEYYGHIEDTNSDLHRFELVLSKTFTQRIEVTK